MTDLLLDIGQPPIHKVPDDILILIFSFFPIHSDVLRKKDWPQTWLTITHVCKRWREVALNTAQLWAVLWYSWSKREVLEAFISRSRQAPLEVELFEADSDKLTDALHLVLPELGRTKSLTLSMETEAFEEFEEDNYKIPAVLPLIRSLSISCQTMSYNKIAQLPSFVTRSSLPDLTNLFVDNLLISWIPGLFPTCLRSLYIRRPVHQDSGLYLAPLSQIVAVIKELPLLEQLTLLDLFQIGRAHV